MNRVEFLKLAAQQLHPLLRQEGFRGSGSTLRRINDPLVHVFAVQGSVTHPWCYLNLGAHLSFLPPEGGLRVPVTRFSDSHCAFRERIIPPGGSASGWPYGSSLREAEQVIESMRAAWVSQGRQFFAQYATFPDSFLALFAAQQPAALHPRDALLFARIAAHLRDSPGAITFARAGLENTPERAGLLRAHFELFLKKHGAT